ncbi:MAG: hypothetical protein U0350_40025 [Caldilineaceae bacterium]
MEETKTLTNAQRAHLKLLLDQQIAAERQVNLFTAYLAMEYGIDPAAWMLDPSQGFVPIPKKDNAA